MIGQLSHMMKLIEEVTSELIGHLQGVIQEWGPILREAQNSKNYEIFYKQDSSPVTSIELSIHDLFEKILVNSPWPLVSEEGSHPQAAPAFWLLDPIDGTSYFIEGTQEFCVSLGLIYDGYPVFGWLWFPAIKEVLWTQHGKVYYRQENDDRHHEISWPVTLSKSRIRLGCSLQHQSRLNELFKEKDLYEPFVMGAGLKYPSLLRGDFDYYIHVGSTHEWDTAAGQALVEALGGFFVGRDGQRLIYGKSQYKNTGFIAGFSKKSFDVLLDFLEKH